MTKLLFGSNFSWLWLAKNRDIIEFVGTPPFLRFALQVAMATMYFHKAETCVSFKNIFCVFRGPKEQFGIRKKLS